MDSVDAGEGPRAVAEHLAAGDRTPRTTAEVADELGCAVDTARSYLERLVELDLADSRTVGDVRVWWRTDDSDPTEFDQTTTGHLDDLPVLVYRCRQQKGWPMDDIRGDCERLTGYEAEAIQSGAIGFGDLVHPDDRDDVWDTIEAARDTDDPFVVQYRIRTKSGETRWVWEHGRFVEDDTLVGVIGELDDPRRTEREYREEHAFAESVLNAQQDVVYAYDRDGQLLRWNDRLPELTGYSNDELADLHALDLVHADERERVREELAPVLQDGATTTVEFPACSKSGETIPVELTAAPLQEDGDIVGVTGVARDISERLEYERNLRQERDIVQRLLEVAPASIVMIERDGTVVRANERAMDRLGFEWDADYQIGETDVYDEDGEFIPPTERPYNRVFETGERVEDWHCQIDLPDVGRRWISINAHPIVEDDEVTQVIVTSRDITRLKTQSRRLERERDELESELSEIFDRIQDAFFAVDDDWRFTYVNDRAAAYLERTETELLGESIWTVFPEGADSEYRSQYEHAMAAQEPVSFEAYYDPLDSWFEVNAYPSQTGLSVYFRDVTRKKAREQRLERSERRYRTLVENYPRGAVALYDTDLRCTAVGGENLERLGLTESDMVGNYVGDVLPEPWASELVEHYERVLEGETQAFEVQDGDRVFEVYAVPVRDSDGDVFAVLGMSNDITERREREAELVEQREQLDALNSINVVVREITHTAFAQSTRDEVEAAACRELADADSYEFAWIAERSPRSGDIQLRTEADAEAYVSELDLSAAAMAGGPATRALETGEVQRVQDVRSDPSFEPWREIAERYGFRSAASIPIRHEQTTYGVLNVYADRPHAFDGREGDVIGQLGEILGHAIAAVERKRALLSDELVELEFAIEDLFGGIVPGPAPADRITIDETVPAGDDEYLIYGTIEGGGIEAVEALVDAVPHWREATAISEDGDALRYEVRLAEPPVLTAVAALGGSVEQAEILDGDYYMQIRMPLDADVRRVIETVQDAYPDAEVRSHSQVSRDDDSSRHLQTAWSDSLTDRQRAALEAAFHAGYFNWPRDSSGEAVAETLGVSPPTFYQHLRSAENKLFTALLGGAPDE